MAKCTRRTFTEKFKAVRVVRESGKAIGVVAGELDLTERALRAWVWQAATAADCGPTSADDGGAGGVESLATRGPDAAHGARHPNQSDGSFAKENE
jgi:transposase-like protein